MRTLCKELFEVSQLALEDLVLSSQGCIIELQLVVFLDYYLVLLKQVILFGFLLLA